MKGLAQLPKPNELESALNQLNREELSLSEEELVKFSQWARFDPRVADVVSKAVIDHIEK